MSLATARHNLALALFDGGVVQFGQFRLKLHETNPDAPLSPIFFNMRTPDNPKPGPLTLELLTQIGDVMMQMIITQQIPYSLLVGIPNAGDPIAAAVQHAFFAHRRIEVPLIQLLKKDTPAGRRVVARDDLRPSTPDEEILVIDDLITEAHSKLETIHALRALGFIVKHVVVLLDREQGGAQQLAEVGCQLHAVLKLSKLLAYYLGIGKITETQHRSVVDYLAANTS